MTAGLLLLLLVPITIGGLAYVLRSWRSVAALLAAGVALALGVLLLLLPVDQLLVIGGREISLQDPVTVLGRELVLDYAGRLAMGYLFLSSSALFLLAWRFERGDLFAPLGLAILSLLGGVLVVRPLVYAALLLQIAAALAVFPLHAEEGGSARGGLRYLTFYTLALPGLLISHWLLEMYAVSPDQQGYLNAATALIALSFALMLGLFPFHAWVPTVGSDGGPLVAAFLFSVTGAGVWFLLLHYLQAYPWLSVHEQWRTTLGTVGMVTAVAGGLLGMTRRRAGALMGYAVMVDTGLTVVALGLGTQTGVGLATTLVLARTAGVGLMAVGTAGLRECNGGSIDLPDGLGRRAPWSTVALLVGGLSLAGFPFTLGFAARWGLLARVLPGDPAMGLVLLLASFGPAVGLFRLLGRLLRAPRRMRGSEKPPEAGEEPQVVRESPLGVVLLMLFVAVTLILGVYPQPVAAAAARLASYLTLFSP